MVHFQFAQIACKPMVKLRGVSNIRRKFWSFLAYWSPTLLFTDIQEQECLNADIPEANGKMVFNCSSSLVLPLGRIKCTRPSLRLPYKKWGDLGNFVTSVLRINQRAEKGKKGLFPSKSWQAASLSCFFSHIHAFTLLLLTKSENHNEKKKGVGVKNILFFSFHNLTLKVVVNVNEWIK